MSSESSAICMNAAAAVSMAKSIGLRAAAMAKDCSSRGRKEEVFATLRGDFFRKSLTWRLNLSSSLLLP